MTSMVVPPFRPGRARVPRSAVVDTSDDRDYSDRRAVAANIADAIARARAEVRRGR